MPFGMSIMNSISGSVRFFMCYACAYRSEQKTSLFEVNYWNSGFNLRWDPRGIEHCCQNGTTGGFHSYSLQMSTFVLNKKSYCFCKTAFENIKEVQAPPFDWDQVKVRKKSAWLIIRQLTLIYTLIICSLDILFIYIVYSFKTECSRYIKY